MTEPIGTEVLFENDRVRVWEMVLLGPSAAETTQPLQHNGRGRPVLQHNGRPVPGGDSGVS